MRVKKYDLKEEHQAHREQEHQHVKKERNREGKTKQKRRETERRKERRTRTRKDDNKEINRLKEGKNRNCTLVDSLCTGYHATLNGQ